MSLTSGQLNINIGIPNSPQGSDSLYTAFGKIQNNFVNVFTEATSFSSVNIATGNGLSNTVSAGNITIVNTGVTSISSSDTNITISEPNGAPIVTLSNAITGLVSIAAGNASISGSVRASNVNVNNSVFTSNVAATNSITADNITVTTSSNLGDMMNLTPQPIPPVSPTQGTIYYDGFMNMLRVYNGTTWGNIALS